MASGIAALRSRAVLLALLLAPSACGGDDDSSDGDSGMPDGGADQDAGVQPTCADGDVLDLLQAVPGFTVEEAASGNDRYSFFHIGVEQPVDHEQPDGATFVQRITLMHRDCDAPMVLHTTGYFGLESPLASEPTALLDANQIDVEQRYFQPSRPEPPDWSLLTIEQAAADHHRIVEALAPIYGGAWVSTGASKGGMTSVYHRRFYPDDVDATVAYVAPLSFGAPDDGYHPFFDTVGDEACRARLREFQREVLTRRAAMVELLSQDGKTSGLTYERLGGPEAALEEGVIEFTWTFWQYSEPSLCEVVPDEAASDGDVWAFFVSVGGATFLDDTIIDVYSPYYYQAFTQLGYPSSPRAHIDDLLETLKIPRDYLPTGATATYDDGAAMEDIDAWVKAEGERILFVYGEQDPWSAGPFELGQADDSFLFVAPGANHGAKIADLDPDDRAASLQALERWTGVEPISPDARSGRLRPVPPPIVPPPAAR
jgi:PS-10 peptidase S37